MKRLLIVAATVFAIASPALANQCPTLVKQIDEKLATAEITDDEKAQVTELRNTGEQQHEAGNHAEAEATLNEALAILGE